MTATARLVPEQVILVDENDTPTGTAEKMAAHQNNLLHRAFSVFIFRPINGQFTEDFLPSLTQQPMQWELLLQQRALQKYHSPGLWTNTCCSHPRPGEEIIAAGQRRLQEELGMHATLSNLGWFHYNAHFTNGLSENEIDHVLVGTIAPQTLIMPAAEEVCTTRWITLAALQQEMTAQPEQFTPWLGKALQFF